MKYIFILSAAILLISCSTGPAAQKSTTEKKEVVELISNPTGSGEEFKITLFAGKELYYPLYAPFMSFILALDKEKVNS